MTEHHVKFKQNKETEPPMLCLLVYYAKLLSLRPSNAFIQCICDHQSRPLNFEIFRHFRSDFHSDFRFNGQFGN